MNQSFLITYPGITWILLFFFFILRKKYLNWQEFNMLIKEKNQIWQGLY